jgi:hypothetical protein
MVEIQYLRSIWKCSASGNGKSLKGEEPSVT